MRTRGRVLALVAIVLATASAGALVSGRTEPTCESAGSADAPQHAIYRMWNTPDGELHTVLEREITADEAATLEVCISGAAQ